MGRAMPMPYATSTSNRSARPAATTFLATQRAAYAAERSTFVGSLPENAPPPWRAMPPYESTMILRPVSPASPIGPPVTNRPVGLTCMTGSVSRSSRGMVGRMTDSTISARSRSGADVRVVLGGDHDRSHPLGHAMLVLDGDLGLAVRAQVRQLAGLADLGEAARHPVGQGDRQRHELRRVAAGEPEHHPLVAGPELERGGGVVAHLERRIDALGDVRRLLLDRDERAAGLVVEAVVGSRVADVADRVADDRLEVDVGVGRDLAEDEHESGRRRRLARDPGVGVVRAGSRRGSRRRPGHTSCPGGLR